MKNLAAVMCKIKNEGATFPEVSNSNMVLGCFFFGFCIFVVTNRVLSLSGTHDDSTMTGW